MYIEAQEQATSAEAELAQQEKLALSVFVAENQELLAELEDKTSPAGLAIMLLLAEMRCNQAKSSIEELCAQSVSSAEGVVDQAQLILGKDEWKGYPLVEDEVDKIRNHFKEINTIREAFSKTVDGLAEALKKAKKPSECSKVFGRFDSCQETKTPMM